MYGCFFYYYKKIDFYKSSNIKTNSNINTNTNNKMSISNKILYIGTGLDLEPLKQFELTKEFVFVDVMPRS